MSYNTALYIRRRGNDELWQLFLGGNMRAKPSALYLSYLKYFKQLHSDYEWVVLERRQVGLGNRNALFRIGDSDPVDAMLESDELGEVPDRFKPKDVECLSLWHIDTKDKMFRGSISNRMCPECIEKEYQWLYGKDRCEERGHDFS